MSTHHPNRVVQLSYSRVLLACWLLVLLAGMASTNAWAQSSTTPINPISYFVVQEGSSAVSWSQTGVTVDSTTGNSTITFQDNNGGTSTMVWSKMGSLVNWTINLATGGTQSFVDGITQGQIGGFILNSGLSDSNVVLAINGHPYVFAGNILQAASNPNIYVGGFPTFTYNNIGYHETTVMVDYLGRYLVCYNSNVIGSSCISTQINGFQVYFPDGSSANYSVNQTRNLYTYQSTSTAANTLTQIDGIKLGVSGNSLAVPIPIKSFVMNGNALNFSGVNMFAFPVYVDYSGNAQVVAFLNGDGTLGSVLI